jgi:hypothetical protein
MMRRRSPAPVGTPVPGVRVSGPGRAAGKVLLLTAVLSCAAVPPDVMDFLLGSAQAQEDSSGGDQADTAPDGSVSINYTYSRTETQCSPFLCTDRATVESFSGSTVLTPVARGEGFEGSGSGSYGYTDELVTRPSTLCPNGARSYMAHSGSADFVVHAHCTIDNPVTGGPDTSHYDRSTSVVEILLHDTSLHLERDVRHCDRHTEPESWTSEEGSVGFGCFFYGVDFAEGGTYVSQVEVTDDSKGTCTLQFNPPPGPRLRIFGTVQGLIDGKPPVPISNARVVAMKYDELRMRKLSESKPPFRKKTTTSDDEKAKYEIELDLCGEPSRVVVVSALWYEGPPVFAVTNGPAPAPGKPGIPVYLAACVDDKPYTHCYKWKKTGDGYEAEVNFEYGNDDQIDRQNVFMDSEDWKGNTTTRKIMMDSAYIYYNSYRAVKYFDSRAPGYPKNPVFIQGHYLEESCVEEPKGAWYRPVAYAFGDLGRHLEKIDGKGAIFLCSGGSAVDQADAPVNREWHELGHYLQYQMYSPLKSCANCEDHGGRANDNTSWSLIEGFAEFTAALVNKHYGNAAPHLYPLGESVVSLETDYKSWGSEYSELDEELAVAGILWDLHDPGKEIALQHVLNGTLLDNSKVYPNPVDEVSLEDKLIFQVIQKGKPRTVVDLYNAFTGTYVSKINEDMIFLDHGFFADIVDRNYVHDSLAETIPESGHAPGRMRRESPPPSLPGSLLVSDADATFDVTITFLQGDGQYDYSYVLAMKRGAPAYFTMPPEYYPTKAVFSPVSADGKKLPAVFEISSEEYWAYIRSGPEKSAIFKHIPAGGAD